jgi:flagellar biosynthesis chaperone FliJ
MTPEQRFDRLERIARLFIKAAESCGKQTAKLKSYMQAQEEHEAARAEARKLPNDADRQEALQRAVENLNQAREEFRQTLKTWRRRRPRSS